MTDLRANWNIGRFKQFAVNERTGFEFRAGVRIRDTVRTSLMEPENRSGTPAALHFRAGLLVLAVLAGSLYLPVLAGYVPFPADVVLSFPPWEGTPATAACCPGMQHSQLGDLVTQIYPWRTMNAALRPGHVPLWNFQAFMGTPFQAMPMSALFFPLHWFYSLLSIPAAWSLLFIVRSVIIAGATAIFLRRLRASPVASLVSGFVFACSGWVLAFQGRPQLDSAMWLPLMFLAVDVLRSRPSLARVALGAVAFALPVLGGHPEVAFQVIAVAVLYAVYRLFPLERAAVVYALAFAAAGALSFGLAAVQLVPTLEWLGLLSRSLSTHWGSLRSAQILGFLSRDLLHHPNIDGVWIPEGASYIGACAAALLPFAALWKNRRDVLFFAGVAVLCMETAYGWQPAFWFTNHIPVLSGLPNWRLLVAADFALAVLAGFGITAIESRCACSQAASRGLSSTLWTLAGVTAVGLIALRRAGHTAIPVRLNLLLLLLCMVVFVLAAARRINLRAFTGMMVLLVITDLFTAGYAVIPFVRPSEVFPPSPVFDFLRPRAIPMWRVAAVDMVYGYQFELPYRLSTPAGYDFPNRRTARFLSAFKTDHEARALTSENTLTAPKGLLDLTGTRYFVTTNWNQSASRFAALPKRFSQVFSYKHVHIFENPDAVPLLSFLPAASIQVIGNDDDQLAAITSAAFDARRTVVVPRQVDRFWGTPGETAAATIGDVAQENDAVKLTVSADRDGLVYFDETYYPGWVAEVDGTRVPVIRTNYAFMAVPVTRGQHRVRFEFNPQSFRIGLLISGFALLIVAACAAIGRVSRSA
ncbi:MAG TPA: YfhO family protein [Bryobacteraceae bacterium]|nr:YfhO family protein [Bryobacteraceae bacterium]